jgi:hypothetical protein
MTIGYNTTLTIHFFFQTLSLPTVHRLVAHSRPAIFKHVVFTWSERSAGRIACLSGIENMLQQTPSTDKRPNYMVKLLLE